MNTALVWIFWILLAAAAYPFVVYPPLVLLLGRLRRRALVKSDIEPKVSFIITAHNEEARIREKLENALALEYPADKLEIVVASDASTDGTHDIVREYADRGVKLAVLDERGGKSLAQNAGLAAATGEVIVHTDATTILEPGGLRVIVRALADPQVGCVTSHDRSVGEDGTGVETAGLYTLFEIAVRDAESRWKSLISVSGSFYAVRRTLRPPLGAEIIDDFAIPLNVVRHGYRVVAEPDAAGIVQRSRDVSQEYRRKLRTFNNGMVALFVNADMLNPLRFGFTSFQLFSHKIARWLLPFFLVAVFLVNIPLIFVHPFYGFTMVAQVLGYGAALIAYLRVREGLTPPRWLRLPYYLVLVNVAIVHAWWRLIRGDYFVTWEPTRR